jgi:glutamine amidotransferase
VISVIDYGVANLGSMLNMLRRLGAQARLVSTPEEVLAAERIILPGIGAFDQGMRALEDLKLCEPIKERVAAGIPLLGVCLGMQLLGRSSAEGAARGLGLIRGDCQKIAGDSDRRIRVPHMGWSHLEVKRSHALLQDLDAHARFYFVHSYHLVCEDPTDVLATARYGAELTAVIAHENVLGAQFHPEKSHRYGMALLRNFARL